LREESAAWAVLDARPRSCWEQGRLPAAGSFSWEDYTRTDEAGVPYRPLLPADLALALGKLGIGADTPVVVYGDADQSWGGEGWTCWVLAWLGHRGPIRLLSGGIQAWQHAGFPLASGPESATRPPATYEPHLRAEVDEAGEELARRLSDLCVIDTRSTLERLTGRIPGSIHIPWEEFYEGDERRPLPPKALRRLLAEHGVREDRPVVYYCAGGVRSAYAWLVHALSGLPPSRNYEGGMEDWKRRPVP